MNREEKFLIEICRAYLNKGDVEFDRDINWKELFKLAKHHNLLGICYCVLNNSKHKELIPGIFIKSVEEKFFDYVYIFELQKKCLIEVEDLLTASQTRHILFKGAVLRNLYPVPESRAMGDIDLLIPRNDRDKVKAVLTGAGFDCTEQNGPVYNYRKDGVLLEVHTDIISEFGADAFSDAFENATFDGCTGYLDDSYHLAYLIAHTAHHFKFYGAGIRHILDLAVLQMERQIELDKVLGLLKKINLDTFGKVILSVCREWFGVGEKFTDNIDSTCLYLCRCGVFGSLQENKGAIVSRKEMEKDENMSPFMIKLRLAFPPYEKLKNINYIKFIDGRPWLTPYAWCYRFFYNLKNRRSFMTNTVSEIGDEKTKKLAQKELDYFKEIGLL